MTLAYETFGDEGGPPVLLVMGLGAQMVGWHRDFCEALADGRYVIRFDNRDVGESEWLEGTVDFAAVMAGDTDVNVVTGPACCTLKGIVSSAIVSRPIATL